MNNRIVNKFLVMASLSFACSAFAGGARVNQAEVEEEAIETANALSELLDSSTAPSKTVTDNADCVVTISDAVRGGFIVAGSFGRGMASCRNGNEWSRPVFIELDTGSIGLVAGLKVSDITFFIIGDDARNFLSKNRVVLGGDINLVVGENNAGEEGYARNEITVLSYVRSTGVMIDLSLKGGVLYEKTNWNEAAYTGYSDYYDSETLLRSNGEVPQTVLPFLKVVKSL